MTLGIPVHLYHRELEEDLDLLLRFTFRYDGRDYIVHRGWDEDCVVLHCDRLTWSPWSGTCVADLGEFDPEIPDIARALRDRILSNPKDYPYAGEHYEINDRRWEEDGELVIDRRSPRHFALRKPWARIGTSVRAGVAALIAFFACLWYGLLGGQDWAFPAFNTYPTALRSLLLGVCGGLLALIICGIWRQHRSGSQVFLLSTFPVLFFHAVGMIRTGEEFAGIVCGLLAVGLLLCTVPRIIAVLLDERPPLEGARSIANSLAVGLYVGCFGLMLISLILFITDVISILL